MRKDSTSNNITISSNLTVISETSTRKVLRNVFNILHYCYSITCIIVFLYVVGFSTIIIGSYFVTNKVTGSVSNNINLKLRDSSKLSIETKFREIFKTVEGIIDSLIDRLDEYGNDDYILEKSPPFIIKSKDPTFYNIMMTSYQANKGFLNSVRYAEMTENMILATSSYMMFDESSGILSKFSMGSSNKYVYNESTLSMMGPPGKYNTSDRVWFKRTMASGGADMYCFSSGGSTNVLSFSKIAYFVSGEPKGIIQVDFKFDLLFDYIQDIHKKSKTRTVIFEDSGIIITGSMNGTFNETKEKSLMMWEHEDPFLEEIYEMSLTDDEVSKKIKHNLVDISKISIMNGIPDANMAIIIDESEVDSFISHTERLFNIVSISIGATMTILMVCVVLTLNCYPSYIIGKRMSNIAKFSRTKKRLVKWLFPVEYSQLVDGSNLFRTAMKQIRLFLPSQSVLAYVFNKNDITKMREKKNLTVLFADVVGFTKNCNSAADENESWNRLEDFMRIMSNTVNSLKTGEYDKWIGDEGMFWFEGIDGPYEAMKAAYYMQRGLVELNKKKYKKNPIRVKYAIKYGSVNYGVIGGGKNYSVSGFGNVPNFGARLNAAHGYLGTNFLCTEIEVKMILESLSRNPTSSVDNVKDFFQFVDKIVFHGTENVPKFVYSINMVNASNGETFNSDWTKKIINDSNNLRKQIGNLDQYELIKEVQCHEEEIFNSLLLRLRSISSNEIYEFPPAKINEKRVSKNF